MHVDLGAHLDVEALVRLVDAVDVDVVAEMVDVLHGERGLGMGGDADRAHLLSRERARAQVRDMVRAVDARGIGVGGAVREQVLHACYLAIEPTACAAGTWLK